MPPQCPGQGLPPTQVLTLSHSLQGSDSLHPIHSLSPTVSLEWTSSIPSIHMPTQYPGQGLPPIQLLTLSQSLQGRDALHPILSLTPTVSRTGTSFPSLSCIVPSAWTHSIPSSHLLPQSAEQELLSPHPLACIVARHGLPTVFRAGTSSIPSIHTPP